MVRKAEDKASQPVGSEEVAEDHSRSHPVLRSLSQPETLMAAAHKRREAEEFQIKELAEWKICVNGLAATPNGKMFIKSMIQYSGYNDPPDLANAQKMIMNNVKAAFYLRWVRPFLSTDLRKEIEP